jgi:hypothetical protein
MPRSSPLLNHMYTRFREVFGTPNTMLELDSQWTLRPDSDPRAPALFLMVNGSYEKPAVWVFDPYDGGDNVWRTAVEAESDVNMIIKVVQDRVAAASLSWLDGRGNGHLDGHADGHAASRKDGRAKGHPQPQPDASPRP